jgi:hypothetical protein
MFSAFSTGFTRCPLLTALKNEAYAAREALAVLFCFDGFTQAYFNSFEKYVEGSVKITHCVADDSEEIVDPNRITMTLC